MKNRKYVLLLAVFLLMRTAPAVAQVPDAWSRAGAIGASALTTALAFWAAAEAYYAEKQTRDHAGYDGREKAEDTWRATEVIDWVAGSLAATTVLAGMGMFLGVGHQTAATYANVTSWVAAGGLAGASITAGVADYYDDDPNDTKRVALIVNCINTAVALGTGAAYYALWYMYQNAPAENGQNR